MFNIEDAYSIASKLGITFDKYTPEDFLEGINIETEHGSINPLTNVTNDNLETTAKIALAHLNEYHNYYNKEYGLKMFEQYLKTKIIDN